MKFKNVILTTIFAGALVFTSLGNSYASEVSVSENQPYIEVSPLLTYVASSSASLSISSSGSANVIARVTGKIGVTSTSLSTKLQQYKSGSWVTIQTWTASSGTRTCSLNKTKSVTKGYSYRVVSDAKANGEPTTDITSTYYY